MNKQPEALLALADRIEEAQGKPIAIDPQAAAELRRLHEANQELLEALNRMVCNFNWGDMNDGEHKAINHARSVIAKATGEQA